MGKTHILAMALILALFFAVPSSSQGMGNSKSHDQNSYYRMGTPVVSGQTNAIVAGLSGSLRGPETGLGPVWAGSCSRTGTAGVGSGGYYAIDVAMGVYLVNAEAPGYVFTQSLVQATNGVVTAARPVVGTPAESAPSAVWQ